MKRRRLIIAIAARRQGPRAFGEQTSYLRGIIRIAAAGGLRGFVFSAKDVDFTRRRVRGWIPASKGWKRRWFPLPDVIYDRTWGLDDPGRDRHAKTLQRLEEMGIPHFNPDYGDKLQVYRLLSSVAGVAGHLPETRPLTAENLELLGSRYSRLYIKPARGRQGKGICSCRRRGDHWILQIRSAKGVVGRTLPNTEAVVRASTRGQGGEAYLVQQGLDLVTLKKGAVDIRVIVQRNRLGQWRVSAIGVRAGKPKSLVSNLHAGGRALTLTQLVRGARLHEPVRRLAGRIEALTLEAAQAMSQAHPTVGELGIDIGLDTSGKLWILELNRQPGRALFSRARLRRAWRRSRVRVVQFAQYLACARQWPVAKSQESTQPLSRP